MIQTNLLMGNDLGPLFRRSAITNLAAICASIYHTIHTLTLTLFLGLTKRRMGTHWTAWTRIEAHGRARRRMDTHDGERTRSSRSGLQSREAETLNWSEQEAFEDDSRQRDEERRRMDVHASEWKCNAMNKMPSYRREDRAMPLCFLIHKWREWCIVIIYMFY